MFGRVAKISIANKFSELVEMDFADYGDLSTSQHIRDTFPRFSAIACMGEKTEEQASGIVRESAISNWVEVFGAPGIIAGNKDAGFIGKSFR